MKKEAMFISVVVTLLFSLETFATADLNSCNESSGECKALLKSVYIQDGIGYAKLEGGLIPSSCTNAQWGNNWKIPLDSSQGSKETYSMLLAAYLSKQIVQIRTFDNVCTIRGVGVGM